MQSRFLHELGSGDWHTLAEKNPKYLGFLMTVDPPAIFLSLWQANLYVVIEGWHKLGLSNPKVDALLLSPNVEALKLHRHGTFHYHEELIPRLYRKLLVSADAVDWTHNLSEAFKQFFDAALLDPEFAKSALNEEV